MFLLTTVLVNAQSNFQQEAKTSIKLLDQLVGDIEQTIMGTVNLDKGSVSVDSEKVYSIDIASKKLVSLGLVLDFEHAENGFKVLSVTPSSLAEKLLIKSNDYIVNFNGHLINESSKGKVKALFKQLKEQQEVNIVYKSEDGLHKVNTILKAMHIPAAHLSVVYHRDSDEFQHKLNKLKQKIEGTLWAVADNENNMERSMHEFSYLADIPSRTLAHLGLSLELVKNLGGFRVLSVLPGSEAEKLAIKQDDLVISLNDQYVVQLATNNLIDELGNLEPDQPIKIGLLKGNQEKVLMSTLNKQHLPAIKLTVGNISLYSPHEYQQFSNNGIAKLGNELPDQDGKACGTVTVNRARGRISITKIDGEGGKRIWPTYKLPVGKHEIEIKIEGTNFRKKSILMDIKANKKYYLGYFPFHTMRDELESPTVRYSSFWLPASWKVSEQDCHL